MPSRILVTVGKVIGIMQLGGVLGKLAFGYISNIAMNAKVCMSCSVVKMTIVEPLNVDTLGTSKKVS